MHVVMDNGCIAAEMKAREAEVAEKEKDGKQRKEFHERREAVLIVIDRLKHELDSDADQLSDGDLKYCFAGRVCPFRKWGIWQQSMCTIKNCQQRCRR